MKDIIEARRHQVSPHLSCLCCRPPVSPSIYFSVPSMQPSLICISSSRSTPCEEAPIANVSPLFVDVGYWIFVMDFVFPPYLPPSMPLPLYPSLQLPPSFLLFSPPLYLSPLSPPRPLLALPPVDSNPCAPINPCGSGACSVTSSTSPASYACSCPQGFVAASDAVTGMQSCTMGRRQRLGTTKDGGSDR